MQITRTSTLSGITRTMEIDVEPHEYKAWEDGQMIQYSMPHLTVSEREFLISGVTDDEWAEMMVVTDDPSEDDDNLDDQEDDPADYEWMKEQYADEYYEMRDERAEYHERIDMGRNEAGEWLGFM